MDNERLKEIFDKITDENITLSSGEIRMMLLDAIELLGVEE